jgi:predicted nucleic acid-binding protein
MVEKYLLDTNPIIDFFNGRLSTNGKNFIAAIEPSISVITQIELLSNKNVHPDEWKQIEDFIQIATIYELKKEIVEQTILLRQTYKIKTPDAIIAATALIHSRKLITRNISDFKNIPDLIVIDLHSL